MDVGLAVAIVRSMTDEAVIDRVRAGDVAAFEVIMRRYNQRLFRCVRGIVKSDATAEDVLQQAYVSAYLHLHQFQGEARFASWLTRIAVNQALAHARKTARLAESELAPEQEPVSESQTPEEQVSARELSRVLEDACDALPDIYRAVFVMREIEGLSTAETADCLGLSEEAVKVRLYRARGLMRGHIVARIGEGAARAFAFLGPRCDRMVARVLAAIAYFQKTRTRP